MQKNLNFRVKDKTHTDLRSLSILLKIPMTQFIDELIRLGIEEMKNKYGGK